MSRERVTLLPSVEEISVRKSFKDIEALGETISKVACAEDLPALVSNFFDKYDQLNNLIEEKYSSVEKFFELESALIPALIHTITTLIGPQSRIDLEDLSALRDKVVDEHQQEIDDKKWWFLQQLNKKYRFALFGKEAKQYELDKYTTYIDGESERNLSLFNELVDYIETIRAKINLDQTLNAAEETTLPTTHTEKPGESFESKTQSNILDLISETNFTLIFDIIDRSLGGIEEIIQVVDRIHDIESLKKENRRKSKRLNSALASKYFREVKKLKKQIATNREKISIKQNAIKQIKEEVIAKLQSDENIIHFLGKKEGVLNTIVPQDFSMDELITSLLNIRISIMRESWEIIEGHYELVTPDNERLIQKYNLAFTDLWNDTTDSESPSTIHITYTGEDLIQELLRDGAIPFLINKSFDEDLRTRARLIYPENVDELYNHKDGISVRLDTDIIASIHSPVLLTFISKLSEIYGLDTSDPDFSLEVVLYKQASYLTGSGKDQLASSISKQFNSI